MHSSRMHTTCSSSCLQYMLGYTPSRCGTGDPPGCGPGDPPGVGLETSPRPDPLTSPQVLAWRPPRPDTLTSPLGVSLETPLARPLKLPLGVGLETCKTCWDTTPTPWRPARHAGIPPARHAGISHPPVNRITDTCKNITLSQLRCGR